jgi:preprotein translocase subunit SecE
MERIKLYFSESYNELLNNVTWPTSENLQETTTIVLGSIVVISIIILLLDGTFQILSKLIYGLQ